MFPPAYQRFLRYLQAFPAFTEVFLMFSGDLSQVLTTLLWLTSRMIQQQSSIFSLIVGCVRTSPGTNQRPHLEKIEENQDNLEKQERTYFIN